MIAWATLALIIVALFEARVGFAWPTEHLVSGIVDRDAFDEIAGEKLARRTRALLGFGLTSPSRGFERDWASAGW